MSEGVTCPNADNVSYAPSPTRGDCKASGESSTPVPQSGRPLSATVPHGSASGGKGRGPLDPRLPWHVGFERSNAEPGGSAAALRSTRGSAPLQSAGSDGHPDACSMQVHTEGPACDRSSPRSPMCCTRREPASHPLRPSPPITEPPGTPAPAMIAKPARSPSGPARWRSLIAVASGRNPVSQDDERRVEQPPLFQVLQEPAAPGQPAGRGCS